MVGVAGAFKTPATAALPAHQFASLFVFGLDYLALGKAVVKGVEGGVAVANTLLTPATSLQLKLNR
jgi:hypothetical protein